MTLASTESTSTTTSLTYDEIQRLVGKVYTTTLTTCPSSPSYNVTFTYDAFKEQAEQ